MSSANVYTTATLVSNIQLLAHIPVGNSTFTAAEVIRLCDRENQTSIMRQLLSVREGYYRTYTDYDQVADGEYAVPELAIAGALDSIAIVSGPARIPVNLVDPAEQVSIDSPSTTSYSYFIDGNTIKVLPSSFEGVLRVAYMRRPSSLVATSAAARISAIASNVISVTSLPSTITTGETVDACQDQPNFEMLGSRLITGIAGTDITLDSAVTDLAVGDWLALKNQTPVPQIPVEFRTLLEQRVVVKIYELQGYLDKMKAAQMKLTEIENDLFSLISPRTKSQTKVICPTNGGIFGGARRSGVFPTR